MTIFAENQISIIVPVYNTEKYLRRCLDSLINQTYKNLEILLIDDGSQDNSLNIIKEYAEKYPRIRFFAQENRGAGAARNVGLKNARGEYVMFCDSDDTFEPNMCEKMLRLMQSQCVDMVMCNMCMYDEDGTSHIPLEAKSYEFAAKEGRYRAGTHSPGTVNTSLVNKMFKKSIIDDFGITFAEGMMRSEDVNFTQHYKAVAGDEYAVYMPLYNHFENDGSLMYMFESERVRLADFLDKITLFERFYNFLQTRGVFDKNKGYFVFRFRMEMFYSFERLREGWELPFLERLGEFLGKVDLDDWEDDKLTRIVESLKNAEYEKALAYFEHLMTVLGRSRLAHCGRKTIAPAFSENNVAVFFNCDNNNVFSLAVALRSIIEHSSADLNYDIVVLHEGLNAKNIEILKTMTAARANFSLRLFYMGYYKRKYGSEPLFASWTHDNGVEYYRLFAPLIFENYDKIISLDCGLVVKTDVAELASLPFGAEGLLAVEDYAAQEEHPKKDQRPCKDAEETLQITNQPIYFHSGVLVFNLKKVRDDNYFDQFLQAGQTDDFLYREQDVLNSVLRNDVRLIDPAWNFQINSSLGAIQTIKYHQPLERLKNLHYCSQVKPWQTAQSPFAEEWWHYARKTPFYECVLLSALGVAPDRVRNGDGGPWANDMDISNLKKQFWYNRVMSKIMIGKNRQMYAERKTAYRAKIREALRLASQNAD